MKKNHIKKHIRKNRGFTLIELLVVISIIGLLSSVVLASLVTARKKAKDAQRISELQELATALDLYAADHNGLYPKADIQTAPFDDTGFLGQALVPKYIKKLPTSLAVYDSANFDEPDPIDGMPYSPNNKFDLMSCFETLKQPLSCGVKINIPFPSEAGISPLNLCASAMVPIPETCDSTGYCTDYCPTGQIFDILRR